MAEQQPIRLGVIGCGGFGLFALQHQMLELSRGAETPKYHRYGELLRSMMRDQVAWTRDRSSARRVTEANGRSSLALALEADRLSTTNR